MCLKDAFLVSALSDNQWPNMSQTNPYVYASAGKSISILILAGEIAMPQSQTENYGRTKWTEQ